MKKIIVLCIFVIFIYISVDVAIAENPIVDVNSTNSRLDAAIEHAQQEMIKYQWADPIIHGLITGKVTNLSSVGIPSLSDSKEKNVLPYKLPYIMASPNKDLIKNTMFLLDTDQLQGRQYYGEEHSLPYGGAITFNTDTISYLRNDVSEIEVAHITSYLGTQEMENAIMLSNDHGDLYLGFRNQQTATYEYNELHRITGAAGDNFNIGIRPNNNPGSRNYTSLYFWVWDLTKNIKIDLTINLPQSEYFRNSDFAIEGFGYNQMNTYSKMAYNMQVLDQNNNDIFSQDYFTWYSVTDQNYNIGHNEFYSYDLVYQWWQPQ
jgi:hypothetical protein